MNLKTAVSVLPALLIGTALCFGPGFLKNNKTNDTVIKSYQPISVIFDLGGVLLYTAKTTKILGLGNLISYGLAHGFNCKKKLRCKLYAFLNEIEPRDTNETVARDDEGNVIPHIMCNWMKGTESSEQLLEKVAKQAKKYRKGVEINLITSIANMMFNPDLLMQTQYWNKKGLEFVKELKACGCKVYVLSNWDPASFALIHKKYSDIFALFDGIIISGNIGLIKPDKKIYEHIVNTYHLDQSRTFFVDDQLCNVQSGYNCGINGIVCKNNNIADVRHAFFS